VVDIEIPTQFVRAYRAAGPEDLADLASAGQALKAKSLTSQQIADRIMEAGWEKPFAEWYAKVVVSQEGDFKLVEPVAVAHVQTSAHQDDSKRESNRRVGTILAVIASIWLAVRIFLEVDQNVGLVLGIVGLALLWEGFARLALSKGLGRLHGAWAMTALFVHVGLFFGWVAIIGPVGPGDTTTQDLRPAINMTYIVLPVGLSWLLFRLSTDGALKKKAKA
jgi:hypothetical protein